MTDTGWRTVLIESGNTLSLENESLIIETEEKSVDIPIEQIGILIIDECRTTFSVKLISKLTENNVKVIFCNEKHSPHCEIIPYYANRLVTLSFKKQIRWSKPAMETVWQRIVVDKITEQSKIIKGIDKQAFEKLEEYKSAVIPGDKTNREAQAARIYFNTLFGKTFRRKTESPINSALNYGYAIILSAVNRYVSIHGYHTALGINHKSDDNPYNLSCDLMEPFRPVIDRIVYYNNERELDIFYKRELIASLYSEIRFNNKRTTVISAIEEYVENILKELSKDTDEEEEML